jgi:hypothetical protein
MKKISQTQRFEPWTLEISIRGEAKTYQMRNFTMKQPCPVNDNERVSHNHCPYSELAIEVCEPGSSVSTVSDYGLDDRGSIFDRGRGFFS